MWAPDAAEHLLNSCNTQGQTAMYIAAKNGNLEVIKLLIESRANCQIKSKVKLQIESGRSLIILGSTK